MGNRKCSSTMFLVCCTLISVASRESFAADNIAAGQYINGSQTLVSAGQQFVLGFFNRQGNASWFLGIWYKNIPDTVVWVANRDNPIVNSTGILTFGKDGKLVILDQKGNAMWSSNASQVVSNPVAQLLDSGNLVLKEAGGVDYVWQSFDYPSDTLLPNMKIGWDAESGLNRRLTSWKTSDDPSSGNYSFGIDPFGLPQFVLRQGSVEQVRVGPWLGKQFSGQAVLSANTVFIPIFVDKSDQIYYIYQDVVNITVRVWLSPDGLVQHLSWNDHHGWNLLYTIQIDRCENYGLCGNFGVCNMKLSAHFCDCMSGYEPKSPGDWNLLEWSAGCVRKDPNICQNGEGFVKLTGLKLPDASDHFVKVSMDTEDCAAECLKNCSCLAYAGTNFTSDGRGCATWFGDLLDTREVDQYGQDLYVRVAASELVSAGSGKKKKEILVAVPVASAITFLAIVGWFLITTRIGILGGKPENLPTVSRPQIPESDLELPIFDLYTIETATNGFSMSNKIGEGGFGPVYRGQLPSGQEVAVKRLAESSVQGLQEFKNEVLLISKLQHRNLVKLLGCCIHDEERMLIYEYMPNKSLDYFLFDKVARSLLYWRQRVDIIVGVARGLVYLHRDSRLRVIHRDLKASNILLDSEMNPRISDFGMARLFGGDQNGTRTRRIVGTYGYMSPEYAIDGYFSLKSDVFSYGVLLLEILSGKRNRGFSHRGHQLNLLGHAWNLWNEGKAVALMDRSLNDQFQHSEARRYIQIGLLCVQQHPDERPDMSNVLMMLDSESGQLPQPGQPGFYSERNVSEVFSVGNSGQSKSISNEITLSLVEGR